LPSTDSPAPKALIPQRHKSPVHVPIIRIVCLFCMLDVFLYLVGSRNSVEIEVVLSSAVAAA